LSLDRETLRKLLGIMDTGSNPGVKVVEEKELPPEFKPLEAKYGHKMAKAAKDFIERYLEAMFE